MLERKRLVLFGALGVSLAAAAAFGLRSRNASACSPYYTYDAEVLDLEPVNGGAPTTLKFVSMVDETTVIDARLVLANDPQRTYEHAR